MFSPESLPVQIAVAGGSAPLSAQQKKFNRNSARIEKLRDQLQQWQLAIDSYRERNGREVQPLLQETQRLLVQVLEAVDGNYDNAKLSKRQRQMYAEVITGYAAHLLEVIEPQHPAFATLKELYNRHSGGDFDEDQQEQNYLAQQMTQEMVRDMFGADIDAEEFDFRNPDAVIQKIQAHMQAEHQAYEQAQAEAEQQRAKRPRKPSARELKAQAEAAQATQSVREVYRKLASLLHPDRESDPAERERKTALMQRVNQAYQDNKLLDLLQLQLEVEQIDADHIANLSEERLKYYNRVLAEQVKELEDEIACLQEGCFEFGFGMRSPRKPSDLMAQLRQHTQGLNYQLQLLQRSLNSFAASSTGISDWVKTEYKSIQEDRRREALFPQDW